MEFGLPFFSHVSSCNLSSLTLISFAPSVLSLYTQSATRLLRCPLPRFSKVFNDSNRIEERKCAISGETTRFNAKEPRASSLEMISGSFELTILALSEIGIWKIGIWNKYPIFAQNGACVGASCLGHLFLPIFP